MKTTCMNVCKYLVFFFNFLFFLGGGFLIGLGVYALVSKESIAQFVPENVPIKQAIGIFIFVGSVIFVSGFFGCLGAIRESKCLLMTFFVVVLIIFIFQIVGVILMYVYYPKVGPAVVKQLNKDPDTFRVVQSTLKCCGYDGPNDYTGSKPGSCYKDNNNTDPSDLYEDGCKKVLFKYFWYIGGVGIFILFVEILAMISALILFRGVDNYETAA